MQQNNKIDLDELFGLKPPVQSNNNEKLQNEDKNYNNFEKMTESELRERLEYIKKLREYLEKDLCDKKMWSCNICTFINNHENEDCEMCKTRKGEYVVNEEQIKNYQTKENKNEKKIDKIDQEFIDQIVDDIIKKEKSNIKNVNVNANVNVNVNKDVNVNKNVSVNENNVDSRNCYKCKRVFSFFAWKYNCKCCKYYFCDSCTSKKVVIHFGGSPEKVCDKCYLSLTSLKNVFNIIKK